MGNVDWDILHSCALLLERHGAVPGGVQEKFRPAIWYTTTEPSLRLQWTWEDYALLCPNVKLVLILHNDTSK